MSAGEKSAGSAEVTHHPLVPHFSMSADDQDESAVALETFVGFVGDSRKPSAIRIYSDLALRSYCEVELASVVSATPADPTDDLSPSVVRVKSDAHVQYVRTDRMAGDASYVAGRVMALYGNRARDFGRPTVEGSDELGLGLDGLHHPPYPITPVLYCVSQVYPPCP